MKGQSATLSRVCRSTTRGLLAGTLILMSMLVSGIPARAGLYLQYNTVDSVGTGGGFPSLALDASGHPHISYTHFDLNQDPQSVLKYAVYDGATWRISTVDSGSNLGADDSLALDASGQPHISYADSSMGTVSLKYAVYDGSSWQVRVIPDQTASYHSSLALDANGTPHIAYFDTTGPLKYAVYDGSDWLISTVDAALTVPGNSSLVLDTSGHPHISYYGNFVLKYAVYDGTQWQISTVDSAADTGSDSSLALDANGAPHISYYDLSNNALKYAVYDGTKWQITTVDSDHTVQSIGTSSSLALDANGQPHISYDETYDLFTSVLKYAVFDGTTWQITKIANESDWGSSLALDADGYAHMSYVNDKSLKYVSEVDDVVPPVTSAFALTTDNSQYTSGSWTNQAVTVVLSASDSGSGVAETFYTIDGGPRQTYYSSFTISSDGDHTITYWSVDNVGNVESSHIVELKIDRTNPTVSYSGNQGTYSVDQMIDITCNASDNLSGVASTTCQDISGPAYSFSAGTHTFSATATDYAGNLGTGSTTFTVVVTYSDLCNLSKQFVTNGGVALSNDMCAQLFAAQSVDSNGNLKAKAQAIGAYLNDVDAAVNGYYLSPANADILKNLAASL